MNYIRIFVGKQKVENKDYPIDISGDTQFDEIIDIIHNKIHELVQSNHIHQMSMIQTIKIGSSPNLKNYVHGPLRDIVPITNPLFIDVQMNEYRSGFGLPLGGTKRRKHKRKTKRRC